MSASSGPIRVPRSRLRRWWDHIAEPDVTLVYCISYAGMILTGMGTIFSPPRTIESVVGYVLTVVLGVFLLLGGSLALAAAPREFWALERIGLAFIVGALVCYGYLVLLTQIESHDGSRWTQLGVMTFSGLAFYVVRWLRIRTYTYRPRAVRDGNI